MTARQNRHVSSKLILTWKWGNNPEIKDDEGRIVDPGQDEYTSTRGYVFGHYNGSLKSYTALAAEARRDFPHLRPSEIECARVTKSDRQKGFVLVHFPLPANATHPSYESSSRPPDFSST